MTKLDKEIKVLLYDPNTKQNTKVSKCTVDKLFDIPTLKRKLKNLRANRAEYLKHATPADYREAIKDLKIMIKTSPLGKKTKSKALDPKKGTLTIKGDKKKMKRLAKHLAKEHPSTKGKMKVLDPAPLIGKPKYFICDYCGEKKLIANGMTKKNNHLQCPDCKNVYNFAQFKKESDKIHDRKRDKKYYDPAPKHKVKFYSGIPARWFEAMVKGINNSSDVRNPYAIVKNIWAKLSPSKKAEIKQREAKGEQFHYDLPLPDDRVTRGEGTLRMVKPFHLAEAQVNVSKKDMEAVKKSGIFKPMKRQDGTTCQVARCKGERPVNIFVDEV